MKKRKKFKLPKAPKADPNLTFSYKEPAVLKRYLTEQGYIYSRDRSGLSAKQQRQLAQEVKRARQLALLPFTQTVK